MLQKLLHLNRLLLVSFHYLCLLPVQRGPQLSIFDVASAVLSRAEGSPSPTCWQYFTTQDTITYLKYNGTPLFHFQLDAHRYSQVFFYQVAFQLGSSSMHMCMFLSSDETFFFSCLTTQDTCQPKSPACPGPFGRQHELLVSQLLLPLLHHQ